MKQLIFCLTLVIFAALSISCDTGLGQKVYAAAHYYHEFEDGLNIVRDSVIVKFHKETMLVTYGEYEALVFERDEVRISKRGVREYYRGIGGTNSSCDVIWTGNTQFKLIEYPQVGANRSAILTKQ